jgi:chorismate synthase
VCIDGLPAGLKINFDELYSFIRRRSPGNNSYSTTRREADIPEILSGVVNGVTCGAPFAAIIKNTDMHSSDYNELNDIPRPSHADYTAYIKYHGFQDAAGGGHFSGRITAPLCVAGGICIQLLKTYGIEIAAHISSICGVDDIPFDMTRVSTDDFIQLRGNAFPVIDALKGAEMQAVIEEAKKNGDSVGGIIECAAVGVPAGIGDPIFEGMENRISSVIFGIPAVKGIEFGNGFGSTTKKGSENNDGFYSDGGNIKTKTNNHGGILGGITSGMPLIFRVAIKPTPSISIEQDSVRLSNKENTKLQIKGRHDPCIIPRAVPCVEAAAAVAICDALLEKNNIKEGK